MLLDLYDNGKSLQIDSRNMRIIFLDVIDRYVGSTLSLPILHLYLYILSFAFQNGGPSVITVWDS